MSFGRNAELVACAEGGKSISFHDRLLAELADNKTNLTDWLRMAREANVEVERYRERDERLTILLESYAPPSKKPAEPTEPEDPSLKIHNPTDSGLAGGDDFLSTDTMTAGEAADIISRDIHRSIGDRLEALTHEETPASGTPEHDCQEYAGRTRRVVTRAAPLPNFPDARTSGPQWIYACTICDTDLGDAPGTTEKGVSVRTLVMDIIDERPGRNWRVAEIAEAIQGNAAMKGRKPNALRSSVKQACYFLANKGKIRKLATPSKGGGSGHRGGVAYRSTIQIGHKDPAGHGLRGGSVET